MEMASALASASREPRMCTTARPLSSTLNHMAPRPTPLVPGGRVVGLWPGGGIDEHETHKPVLLHDWPLVDDDHVARVARHRFFVPPGNDVPRPRIAEPLDALPASTFARVHWRRGKKLLVVHRQRPLAAVAKRTVPSLPTLRLST